MYCIVYRSTDFLSENYAIIGNFDEAVPFCECILLDGEVPKAIVIRSNILPFTCSKEKEDKMLLKSLVRCYIIKSKDLPTSITEEEIIKRYGW